jgi:hypothetical protein
MNFTDTHLMPTSTVKIPLHKPEEIPCSSATSLMVMLVFYLSHQNMKFCCHFIISAQQSTSRPIITFCHRSMDVCPAPMQQMQAKLAYSSQPPIEMQF